MPPYVLSVVYPDGNPMQVECFTDLSNALTVRDHRTKPERHGREHWMVHDSDDEERGYFEWDDVEDHVA
jgi:hypothetical protein